MTTGRRIGNAVMEHLVSWNLVPRTVMLTTVGRRTGEERRTPVTLIYRSSRVFLVAPYGPVGEVTPLEAGPVLKDYWQTASAVRSYFDVPKGAPVEAFVHEAHHHPVFELTPITTG